MQECAREQASRLIRMSPVLPGPPCTNRPREGHGTGLWGEGPLSTGSQLGILSPGARATPSSGIDDPPGATPHPRLLRQEGPGPEPLVVSLQEAKGPLPGSRSQFLGQTEGFHAPSKGRVTLKKKRSHTFYPGNPSLLRPSLGRHFHFQAFPL